MSLLLVKNIMLNWYSLIMSICTIGIIFLTAANLKNGLILKQHLMLMASEKSLKQIISD